MHFAANKARSESAQLSWRTWPACPHFLERHFRPRSAIRFRAIFQSCSCRHLEQPAYEGGGGARIPFPRRHALLPLVQPELRLEAEGPPAKPGPTTFHPQSAA